MESILSDERLKDVLQEYSRESVTHMVQNCIHDVRDALTNGSSHSSVDHVVGLVLERCSTVWKSWPRQVINATGVIIHTNLGRSPLSEESLEAVRQAAVGYIDLEIDLTDGTRGSRQNHVANLITDLTGAEASLVVNNNASALMLGLRALSNQKTVIVSRGEAVEIGGGFRIPDVLRESGAILKEVGTTNRTYVGDYANAIDENTGAILKIHSSNFRISGFTHEATIQELTDLAHMHQLPVIHDVGSGCLIETTNFGLEHEPTVQESVSAGVDVTFFSGDKLLGGPQSGLAVGRRDIISSLTQHPMARALRIDKLNLAALHSTLLHYTKGEALHKIPIWEMISRKPQEIDEAALRWSRIIGVKPNVIDGLSTIGGGSLPGASIPTRLLALNSKDTKMSSEELATRLRLSRSPVMARIQDDQVIIDPRTVLQSQETDLLETLKTALGH